MIRDVQPPEQSYDILVDTYDLGKDIGGANLLIIEDIHLYGEVVELIKNINGGAYFHRSELGSPGP